MLLTVNDSLRNYACHQGIGVAADLNTRPEGMRSFELIRGWGASPCRREVKCTCLLHRYLAQLLPGDMVYTVLRLPSVHKPSVFLPAYVVCITPAILLAFTTLRSALELLKFKVPKGSCSSGLEAVFQRP
jgi:hypothetical protein